MDTAAIRLGYGKNWTIVSESFWAITLSNTNSIKKYLRYNNNIIFIDAMFQNIFRNLRCFATTSLSQDYHCV